MADFNLIPRRRLAVGGQIVDAHGVQQLWEAGVNAVIDCQAEFDDGPLLVHQPGMTYIWLPVGDDGQPKPPEWFLAGYDFAQAQLDQHRSGVVYAHCAAGVNRGPSMAYFLLRAIWNLSPASAEKELRAARPQVGIAYKPDADRALTVLHMRPKK